MEERKELKILKEEEICKLRLIGSNISEGIERDIMQHGNGA